MFDSGIMTSVEAQNRVASVIAGTSQHDTADDLIKSIFGGNDEGQKRFKDRINIKDYNVTGKEFTDEELKKQVEELKHQEIISWLSNRIPQQYTETYIAIKRKNYLSNMIEQIKGISDALTDNNEPLLDMFLTVLTNEISSVYKNFIQTGQDEHFLSIVNLFEDILCNKRLINKVVLKESAHLLQEIKNKDTIELRDYEYILGKFFDKGVNVMNFKSSDDKT